MKSRRCRTGVLSATAAVAVAREVYREEERSIWEKYLAFIRGEGFDAEQMRLATRPEDDPRLDRASRVFSIFATGLAAAAVLAALTLNLAFRTSEVSALDPHEIAPADGIATYSAAEPDKSSVFLP